MYLPALVEEVEALPLSVAILAPLASMPARVPAFLGCTLF